ncbi:MAG: carbohydrate ABC transporter permease [Bacillota bacterium]
MKNRRRQISRVLTMVLMIILSGVFIFPFFWLVRGSFMRSIEIFTMPMKWLPDRLMVENYVQALTKIPFLTYFKNTAIIVTFNVIGCVLSSSFAAFGFSRIRFRGRNFWFAVMMSTMMIPDISLLIPQFIGWKTLGAYDTFYPLIVPAFFSKALFVFLIRQFFSTIPKAYDEAAFIDGANYMTIYARIMLPLSKPVLATIGVFTFMFQWNDFFGPLIYLSSSDKYTLSLGLQSFLGQYTSQWNLLMAASSLIILPMILLFFFAQRFFIEGIAFTGLKG